MNNNNEINISNIYINKFDPHQLNNNYKELISINNKIKNNYTLAGLKFH